MRLLRRKNPTPAVRRIRVTEVVERDTDRVLLAGRDVATGGRVTFHLRASAARLDVVVPQLLGGREVEL